MKRDRIYLYTFLGLVVITFVVGYFSMSYLLEVSTNQYLQTQVESSKREAHEISNLLQYQLEAGMDKEQVVAGMQNSIEHTVTESGFICMFDWSGMMVCHPKPEHVGKQVLSDESEDQPLIYSEPDIEDIQERIKTKTDKGDITGIQSGDLDSEIIYLYPVKDTDWIVAAHANVSHLKDRIQKLKTNFIIAYALSGILIVILSFFMIRLISGYYERKLEAENRSLSEEVTALSKLNTDLAAYKERLAEGQGGKRAAKTAKMRITAYVKDEIVPVSTSDIAYIYLENGVTRIRSLDDKTHYSNSSLDELFSDLDKSVFFRANRQFILSINALEKIYKYGNNQLKIDVSPTSPAPIIISKNKAAEFKKWLNL